MYHFHVFPFLSFDRVVNTMVSGYSLVRVLCERPAYQAILPAFNDSNWAQVPMNNVDFSYPIQVFRIPFSISVDSANALELSIDYSCGIQVYGNGFLLFQDNIESFGTNATGCYREHHHHVLLMNTHLFTLRTNILAVVLSQSSRQTVSNYLSTTLSAYIPSTIGSCYSIPYDYHATLICDDQLLSLNDMSSITIPHSSCSLVLSFADMTVDYEGIRFSLTDPIHTIEYMEVFTSRNITTSKVYENRLIPSQPYIEEDKMTFFFPFNNQLTNVLLLKSIETRSCRVHLSNMELLVCSHPRPSYLTFSTDVFFGYAGITSINITPLEFVTNCTIQPTLPQGLLFDSLRCRVSGVVENPVYETFRLSTQHNSIQGMFSLNISSCESHILQVIRHYRKQPQFESWILEQSEGDSWIRILGEGIDDSQHEDDEHIWKLCAEAGKYRITVSSLLPSWSKGSFLLLYDITEQKQLLQTRYDSQKTSASIEYVYVGIPILHSSSPMKGSEEQFNCSDPSFLVHIKFYSPFLPSTFDCFLDEESVNSSYPYDWVSTSHSFSVSMESHSFSYNICLPIMIYKLTCHTLMPSLLESAIPAGITVIHGNEDVVLGMSPFSTSEATVLFTNLLAFTTKASDLEWRVVTDAPSGWQALYYNDSNWSILHFQSPQTLGYMDSTSVYLRHSFLIPSLTTFITLNVATYFQGGLIAWMNGQRVALFHVTEESDGNFTALNSLHPQSFQSSFHIVLLYSAAIQGLNVLAIQLVYPKWLHSFPIHFSAVASYGIAPLALCINSFLSISTSLSPVASDQGCGFSSSALIDEDLSTACVYRLSHLPLTIRWELENREGGRFSNIELIHNRLNTTARWRYHHSSTLQNMEDEGYSSLQSFTNTHSLSLKALSYPSSTVITALDLAIVEKESILAISNIHMTYHHTTSVICPTLNQFATVVSGGISIAPCPDGLIGTMKRVCVDGVFSDIDASDCLLSPPTNLKYSQDVYSFVVGVSISLAPSWDNTITEFIVSENFLLPEGLQLNSQTGYISGTPTKVVKDQHVIIYGSNESGACSCSLIISTRTGVCATDGIFPETHVGVTITIPCSSIGKFVGTISRTCQIGVSEGVWNTQRGICIPVLLIVMIGCSVLCLVVILIVLCISTYGRMKSRQLARRMMYHIKEDVTFISLLDME